MAGGIPKNKRRRTIAQPPSAPMTTLPLQVVSESPNGEAAA